MTQINYSLIRGQAFSFLFQDSSNAGTPKQFRTTMKTTAIETKSILWFILVHEVRLTLQFLQVRSFIWFGVCDSSVTAVHQGPRRAERAREGGSPMSSCCAGTLTAGAHRPWNACHFRESALFRFNSAINCLSVLWSGDHRRSDTDLVSPDKPTLTFQSSSVRPCQLMKWDTGRKKWIRPQGDFCPAGLIWNRSPFETVLSLSHLYRLPIFARGSAFYGADEESAGFRMEQIVDGFRGGDKVWRQTELGEVAGLTGENERNPCEDISVFIPPIFACRRRILNWP